MAQFKPQEILERVRTQAERGGAAQADAFMEVALFTEVRVRQHEVELIRQSAIQGVGLRIFRDRRVGFCYTTDIRPNVLDEMVTRTMVLAAEASPRDENKIPEETPPADLDLEIHDPAIVGMRPEQLTVIARQAESSAFAVDQRVQQTADVRCGIQWNETYFSNTYIPFKTYRASACWLSVEAVATQGDRKRTGGYADRKRLFSDLETAERIGTKAGTRAIAKLTAAPVPSAKVPVIFEAEAAGAFLRGLFGAFNAENVLEQRSFLSGKKGTAIASPLVTIVDDGIMRRGIGSRPFDGEGIQSRRTLVVDHGVLNRVLHTGITARRMGSATTGNAARSYDSLPAVGPTNFYIERGTQRLSKLIADVPRGLLVTDLAGFGVDVVSGEFSQQVEGTWIEGGKRTKAVEGVTIGGKLQDMLLGIDGVGNDLEYRSNVCSPSIRFKELTVGGV
jgi:PmbA protein